MNPQLSIIIPFYGKADKTLLQYCIDSINNQAIPLEKYRLPYQDYEFSFIMSPVSHKLK